MTCDATIQTATHGGRSVSPLHRAIHVLRGLYAPVAITENGPPTDGAPNTTPDLTARALRVNNRSKEAAERYERLHQILASKPSSRSLP